jgi:hypothetical protein
LPEAPHHAGFFAIWLLTAVFTQRAKKPSQSGFVSEPPDFYGYGTEANAYRSMGVDLIRIEQL